MTDVIILGAGTAGLSAAIYAKRAKLSVTVIENNFYGGQIINSPEVENYPGFKKISGFDFAQNLHDHAESFGTELIYENIIKTELSGKIKKITTENGDYEAKTVIIATGASHRKLGIATEDIYIGSGVSYCATCDGAFYQGKKVAVVGGGNTAIEDALYLSNMAQEVYLIHRRQGLRAEPVMVDILKSKPNVKFILDATVSEIFGDGKVEGVKLNTPEGEKTLSLDGIFVAVGMKPESGLFGGEVSLDEAGYVVAGEDCRTNLSGVFVAGDIRTKPLRQLVTAAADGAVAATEAAHFLA